MLHISGGCVSDVGFVLDSSGSLRAEYGKEKRFVIEIAKAFGSGSRHGVVTFSHKAVLSIPLGAYNDHRSFADAVNAIPHMGYTTRIDLALLKAERELFGGYASGSRYVKLCIDNFSRG